MATSRERRISANSILVRARVIALRRLADETVAAVQRGEGPLLLIDETPAVPPVRLLAKPPRKIILRHCTFVNSCCGRCVPSLLRRFGSCA